MGRSGRHCRTIRTTSADVRRSHAFPQRSARTPSCLSALRRSSSSAECTTSRLMPACSADCTTSPKSAFETPTTRTDAFAVTIASRYPHSSAAHLRHGAPGVRGVLGSWYSSCVPIIGRKPSILNPLPHPCAATRPRKTRYYDRLGKAQSKAGETGETAEYRRGVRAYAAGRLRCKRTLA